MALIANYGDLQSALSEWLRGAGDTSLAGRADQLIVNFESEFVLDPDMRTFEMEETDTTVVATANVPLPAGFLEMIRLKALASNNGADQQLEYVSPAEAARIDLMAQNSLGGTGIAKYFTILSGNIVITPQTWAPVGATLEMSYYQFINLKDASGGTNWLLQKYPNIYLYGSLMQAAAYVGDDAETGKWSAGLTAALAKLSKSDRKRKTTGGVLAQRPSVSFIR